VAEEQPEASEFEEPADRPTSEDYDAGVEPLYVVDSENSSPEPASV
jgi:hypothetical protein